MSQTTEILAHLKSGKRLDPIQALEKFGCFSLSQRITDLRNAGHDIHMELTPNRDRTKHYGVYTLMKSKR